MSASTDAQTTQPLTRQQRQLQQLERLNRTGMVNPAELRREEPSELSSMETSGRNLTLGSRDLTADQAEQAGLQQFHLPRRVRRNLPKGSTVILQGQGEETIGHMNTNGDMVLNTGKTVSEAVAVAVVDIRGVVTPYAIPAR